MQTFLPYRSFTLSAQCLDSKRLGKQRVEVLQILRTLNGETKGWRHHPAVRMWDGHTEALIEYGVAMCQEWLRRGFADTCLGKILACGRGGQPVAPPWLGNHEFHASHQSNLLRKLPQHYGRFGWSVPPDLPYVWPTNIITKKGIIHAYPNL